MARRLSCRRFDPVAPLDLGSLSTLLSAAYGTGPETKALGRELPVRPVPSASGLYKLEILVFARAIQILTPAIYRCNASRHEVRPIAGLPDNPNLQSIFADQAYIAEAQAILVMTGKPKDVAARYMERAYRYMLLECGHIGQNLALAAASLGLGACPVGGFEDFHLGCAAGLEMHREWPLYGMAIGSPNPGHSQDLRTPDLYA